MLAESSDRTLVDLTEESEELEDVRTPTHDQLKKVKAWWILELLPTRFREQILKDDQQYMWKHSWKCVFLYRLFLSHSHGYGSLQDELGSRTLLSLKQSVTKGGNLGAPLCKDQDGY
jgi:hypothetical protein